MTSSLDLSAFRPRGVVFDLDGTLADNMFWHAKAFDEFVARHGLAAITMEQRRRIDGKRNREIMPILFGRDLTDDEVRRFEDEKESAYRELSRAAISPTAGVVRLLDRLAAHDITCAVATSAPAPNVRHTLDAIGLADCFHAIVRSDQVPHGKPAPDVFLEAARALGVPPESCLAFEDAPVGMTAARRAGMHCVAITSTFPPEAFADGDSKADETYADFDAYLAGSGRWLIE